MWALLVAQGSDSSDFLGSAPLSGSSQPPIISFIIVLGLQRDEIYEFGPALHW